MIMMTRKKNSGCHVSLFILNGFGKTKLIDSSFNFCVRIWEFHSGKLLKKINLESKELRGLCLWNDHYLLVACSDKNIKLVDLKTFMICKSFRGHRMPVGTIQKINHPVYGECLISQGLKDDQIKLWAIKAP